MGEVIANPRRAAEEVCHDEQMQIWAHEVLVAVGMCDCFRDFHPTTEDVIELEAAISQELRSIIRSAFNHPEARTVLRKR